MSLISPYQIPRRTLPNKQKRKQTIIQLSRKCSSTLLAEAFQPATATTLQSLLGRVSKPSLRKESVHFCLSANSEASCAAPRENSSVRVLHFSQQCQTLHLHVPGPPTGLLGGHVHSQRRGRMLQQPCPVASHGSWQHSPKDRQMQPLLLLFSSWSPASESIWSLIIKRFIQTRETAQMLKNKLVLESVAELACFA